MTGRMTPQAKTIKEVSEWLVGRSVSYLKVKPAGMVRTAMIDCFSKEIENYKRQCKRTQREEDIKRLEEQALLHPEKAACYQECIFALQMMPILR